MAARHGGGRLQGGGVEPGGTCSLGGSPWSKACGTGRQRGAWHGFVLCSHGPPSAACPGAVLRMEGSKAGLSLCQHKPTFSMQEGQGESPSAPLTPSAGLRMPRPNPAWLHGHWEVCRVRSTAAAAGPNPPCSVLVFLSPVPSCPTQSSFCGSFPSLFPLWLAGSRMVMVSNAESC